MPKHVLFIGLGGAGQRHLRNLKKLYPDVKISAVRRKKRNFEIGIDLTADKSVDIVKKYNITEFESISDAVSSNPDFAIVANPTAQHFPTTLDLLERKIPVFLEKPIATEKDNIDLLANTVTKSAVELMVAYQLRFHPCVVEAKKIINSGEIGKIYSANIHVHSFMPSWHPYENYEELYASKSELGGGVILTEVHEIDLITWFFGLPEKVVTFGGTLSNLNIDVEDTISSLMYMNFNGNNFPLTLNMSFVQSPPSRMFKVFGEKGHISLNIPKDELLIFNNETNMQSTKKLTTFNRNEMFENELIHFINSLESRTQTDMSIHNTIQGQKLANAMKLSLANNKIIICET